MDVKALTANVEELNAKIEANNGVFDVGNVSYKFNRFRHKERVRVFGFLTSIIPQLEQGNFDFLSSEAFERIESIIANNVTVNGMSLAKIVEHWETGDNGSHYIPFVVVSLQYISYPLLRGDLTS